MAQDEAPKQKITVPPEAETVIKPERTPPAEHAEGRTAVPEVAAVMAIRNTVVFPGTVMPLKVGREKSRRLLDEALSDHKLIVLATQRDSGEDDPKPEGMYDVGTAAVVLKLLRSEEGEQTIIAHGLSRVHLDEFVQVEPYFRAHVTPMEDVAPPSTEMEARLLDVRQKALRVVQLSPNVPDEAQVVISSIEQPGALTDFLSANLPLDTVTKQSLLAQTDVNKRLEILQAQLHRQVQVLELSGQIQDQVRANISKDQREYFLREQMKAIQKELGQADEQAVEIQELTERINAANMPEAVKAESMRELHRLERIPSASPEYNVIRTYLDIMLELPWSKTTPDNLDINRARRVLDADHYDLEKVKKRILEYLAVRKLAPDSHGTVLCFVGPPGVGKTSLGQSIARALGRKFIRMSLGGMRDEAELRGHRRTYIGAMPGRVIQEIRKAGTSNPVFMLDELDKVGMDFRGDPTSALLEVLDPAQNNTFQDHYLNVPFDLSKVMFIGTANIMTTVPAALRDRMEIIDIPGYTQAEKLRIAERYLMPRQNRENGLEKTPARLTSSALRAIIMYYTREAGVRELERQIGAICRGLAARIASDEKPKLTVDAQNLQAYLGPRQFESELAQRTSVPGVATGLAYTATGGEIIFIEATSYPGKGSLTLTGQIGDVMRESAQAALSLLRSRASQFGIDAENFPKVDIHVHVPAGAVPKDGPSAGVAITTALASLMLNRPIRSDVAMTGEITLRGLVLPVGGVKEKVLAARQAGIRTVILPERNRKDLVDVPADARKKIKFVFATQIDQVLAEALSGRKYAPPQPQGTGQARRRLDKKPKAKVRPARGARR
jgi:ATP-dependent Lon protease